MTNFLLACLKPLQFFTDSNKVEENGDSWESYLGDEDDPKSSIMIRFPDGKREKKEIPCSSQFRVSICKWKSMNGSSCVYV